LTGQTGVLGLKYIAVLISPTVIVYELSFDRAGFSSLSKLYRVIKMIVGVLTTLEIGVYVFFFI